MKKLLLALMFVLLMAVPAEALQLLMFSTDRCSYCRAFLEEVAPEYVKSKYAKHLPLRVIDIELPPPRWIMDAFDERRLTPIDQTPTFVIWDKNKEVARLVGYVGKKEFYDSISVFIEENTGKLIKPPNRGPMDEWGSVRPYPEGVINSRDLHQHMYKTPELALKASDWFGCHGNIHYHEAEKVWMPCTMN
tara:strand:- start:36 stop:608 length:573 start_codon:yes stop_codon:yes gene_type:complete